MRHIMFITGSRGEYGYIRPILNIIKNRPDIKYSIVATNLHLLPNFGSSINFFEADGLKVSHEIYMAMDGRTATSMSKSLGIFLTSITDILHNEKPDIVLISGDRGEQLMAAIAAAHMNIIVAHIQAGEVSGNIDGLTRHAIARYAHIHFASNEDAYQRLIKSGEQPFRVHKVGAPQLDDFLLNKIASKKEVIDYFHINENEPIMLLVQHPVTEQCDKAYEQMSITLKALSRFKYQTIQIYPNNDAGSTSIQEAFNSLRGPWLKIERSVSRELYAGLMKIASVIIGNSSSGILEAPCFELPAINIGRRQEGRLQGKNVINVDYDEESIYNAINLALSAEFKAGLKGIKNPYGDGLSSERIVNILSGIVIDEKLLYKKLTF